MSRFIIVLIALIVICTSVNAGVSKVLSKTSDSIKGFLSCVVNSLDGQTVSAAIKDTTINGVDGLNIEFDVPFKIQDYVVGFTYRLGQDLTKLPEKLFAKRDFSTAAEGKLDVNAKYLTGDKVFEVQTGWKSEKAGVKVEATLNTKDKLKSVGIEATKKINDVKVTLESVYDHVKNNIFVGGKASTDDISALLEYQTDDEDAVLTLSKKIDEYNTVSPKLSFKTKDVSYIWNRKFENGILDAEFNPGNNLVLEWTDKGANGDWTSKFDIPVNDQANTKVSFSRKWSY